VNNWTMTPEEVLVVMDICAEHIPDGCDVYHAQLEEARATVAALIEEREQLKADLEAFRDGSEQMALAGIKMREEINNLKIECSAKQAEIDKLCREEQMALIGERDALREALQELDVYTLVGDAEVRRMDGETDMPDYLIDLAARIADAIGNSALADRTREIAKPPNAVLSGSQPEE